MTEVTDAQVRKVPLVPTPDFRRPAYARVGISPLLQENWK